VLVIHEKHGLNLYIADVVRRVVKAAIWPSRPMG
jgi:dienelactone hydrolase